MLSDSRYQYLHQRARGLHTQKRYLWLYTMVRWLLLPVIHVYFRVSVQGHGGFPRSGATIVAANHASFSDSFFVALLSPRPMRWMGKAELFVPRWRGWLLVSLGAFPVRRGSSDEHALHTARTLLQQGELLALFPEGTRNRGGLGTAKRGMARLALETGATVVPVAIAGTARLRRGWRIKPGPVRMMVGTTVAVAAQTPDHRSAEQVTAQVWPQIVMLWQKLQRHPRRSTVSVAASVVVLWAAWRWVRQRQPMG